MHLLLTDKLSCPRCGPEFGLILRADQMVDRRVLDGVLGCPNCRDAFPIVDGFTDLRAPPRGPLDTGRAGDQSDAASTGDEVDRLAALLGIVRGPGTVVMVGNVARHAWSLAEEVDDLEVVAIDPTFSTWPDRGTVSRVAAAPGLPFFSRRLRGAVVDGGLGTSVVEEAARVVAPTSRVIVTEAPEDTSSVLEQTGLKVLAAEAGTVVAARG